MDKNIRVEKCKDRKKEQRSDFRGAEHRGSTEERRVRRTRFGIQVFEGTKEELELPKLRNRVRGINKHSATHYESESQARRRGEDGT